MQLKIYPQVNGNAQEPSVHLEPVYITLRIIPKDSSFLEYINQVQAEIKAKINRQEFSRPIGYGFWGDYLSFLLSLEPEHKPGMGWYGMDYHQKKAAQLAEVTSLNEFLAIKSLMTFNHEMAEYSISDPLDSFMKLFEEEGFEKLRETFCTFIEGGNTSAFSKAFEIKQSEYDKEIREWSWDTIKSEAIANASENEEGELKGSCFLGTVMSLFPSGKYYTPYARSNVDELDGALDGCFNDALEAIAEEHGGYIFNGEGDLCDVFFGIGVETEEDDDE